MVEQVFWTWTLMAKLIAADGEEFELSSNNDAARIVVGATRDSDPSTDLGTACSSVSVRGPPLDGSGG